MTCSEVCLSYEGHGLASSAHEGFSSGETSQGWTVSAGTRFPVVSSCIHLQVQPDTGHSAWSLKNRSSNSQNPNATFLHLFFCITHLSAMQFYKMALGKKYGNQNPEEKKALEFEVKLESYWTFRNFFAYVARYHIHSYGGIGAVPSFN